MSADPSFNVVAGDQLLSCQWSHLEGEKGELVFNNITKKSYFTKVLTVTEFAKQSYKQCIENGDQYTVRLLSNKSKNVVSPQVMGYTLPPKLEIQLISRNAELGVKLLNCDFITKTAKNGYDLITELDILIDNGNNEDERINIKAEDVPSDNILSIKTLNGGRLVNGITYEVVVRQRNNAGPGEFSTPQTMKPSRVPHKIQDFAGVESDKKVDLTWTPSSEDVSSDSSDQFKYRIYKKAKGESWSADYVTVNKTYTVPVYDLSDVQIGENTYQTNSYSYTGLTNGETYEFKILGYHTEHGASEDSAILTKKPFTLPDLMTGSNVSIRDLSDNSIEITLTPPLIMEVKKLLATS